MADSPFKLFEPYSSSDKDIFFGRDPEIFALYNLLQQTRLVLFYGASGTGKTSIINAGLPKVFKLTDWSRVSVRRKDNINDAFRQELKRLLQVTEISSLATAITDVYENRWIPVYIVFDQFEEIFTLGDHEERVAFFKDIQQLLVLPIPCKLILSIREEYIGHLYEYEQFVPLLFDKRFRVEPMKDDTTRSVIVDMSKSADVELEEGPETARKILMQVKEGTQAAHLPYLQIYLHYLYVQECKTQKSPGITFTEHGINAVGRLGNVLKTFIESMLEKAREEFVTMRLPDDFASRLLDEFATDEGTKQSRKVDELMVSLETGEQDIKKALTYFSNLNLLRADEDDVSRYEPVHDVVAKQISELRSVESREFKAFVRSFQSDYERWIAENKPETRLLTETDIAKANVYCARLEKIPNYESHWKEYQETSNKYHQEKLSKVQKEAIDKEEQNQKLTEALSNTERARTIAYIIAFVAMMSSLMAWFFYKNAESQREIAENEKFKSKALQEKAERSEQKAIALADSATKSEQRARLALQDKNTALTALAASNKNTKVQKNRAEAALTKSQAELGKRVAAEKQRDSIEVKKYISAANRMRNIQQYDLEMSILKKGLGKFPDDPELLESLKSLEAQIKSVQP
ncbi:hypothetical protein SAMN05216327_113187 [Dyadobacter sp. SG02]|uniref:ATP-binding protein n=1 Tax=Dyadobacter sp. SG02 TaxID=1855291 RepID=UPI0008D89320|nr:ATP-binding protein [Dyadobacter sp. SG02]SEJ59782.1 hypothetical protein SAMN05216327_113187 [Dyadobacter sp. SG02]